MRKNLERRERSGREEEEGKRRLVEDSERNGEENEYYRRAKGEAMEER